MLLTFYAYFLYFIAYLTHLYFIAYLTYLTQLAYLFLFVVLKDLTKKDQHYLSELFIKLSKEEQGDRHHFHQSYYSLNNSNEPMERPGFNYQGDSNFSNGTCPEKGIWSFRYGCSSEGPDPLLR